MNNTRSPKKCEWFTDSTKLLSQNLYYPLHDINLADNTSISTPFVSKVHNFNSPIPSSIQFKDISHLDPINIKKECSVNLVKKVIKIIKKSTDFTNPIKILVDNYIKTNKKSKQIVNNLSSQIFIIMKNTFKKTPKITTISNPPTLTEELSRLYYNYLTKVDDERSVIRSHRYEILLNDEQHFIIKNWIKICNHFYNFCVTKFNEYNSKTELNSIYSFTKPYTSIKKDIFAEYFTKYLIPKNPDVIKYKICLAPYSKPKNVSNKKYKYNTSFKQTSTDVSESKPVPYDMITDELRIFCSNLKSCRTNFINKNTTHYTMNPHSYKTNTRSILLSKHGISINGIFSNILGKNKFFNKEIKKLLENGEIKSDMRLIYDYRFRKVFCLIPLHKKKKIYHNREKFVALDPGVEVFQSYYGEKSFGTFGDKVISSQIKITTKINKLKLILKNKINNFGKKLRNKIKINNRIKKLGIKEKNQINELHHKVSTYLCKKYERILEPKFAVSEMISNTKSLPKRIKREMLKLSHYKFKQQLLSKSKEHGCKVEIVGEEYTSACCGKCGILSNMYHTRTKTCEGCEVKSNRDLNGAFNILLKNVHLL